jgi:hypothetical protein
MKNGILILTCAASLFTGISHVAAAEKVKCTEVIAKLEAEIAKEPSRVLLAVEDALLANDSCSCDVIKTAIAVSKADAKLVGEIVSAAINAVPSTASTIGECALSAAPGAGKEIKQAMKDALGQGDGAGSGKEPIASGKEPIASGKAPIASGKEIVTAPPATVDPGSDYGLGPVGVAGIYFSAPAGGTTTVEKTVVKVVRVTEVRTKRRPHTGSTPATGS